MVLTRGVDLRGDDTKIRVGDVKERSDPARAADRRPSRGGSDHDEAEAKHRQSQKLKHQCVEHDYFPQQTVRFVGNALTVS